jgi:hypothetical protein
MPKKQLVGEALIDLHGRLSALPSRSHDRRIIMRETATLYGLSEQTLYRALAERARPRALRRSDRGTPRVLPQDKMESYCEVIAAIKIRTSNKKGRSILGNFPLNLFVDALPNRVDPASGSGMASSAHRWEEHSQQSRSLAIRNLRSQAHL